MSDDIRPALISDADKLRAELEGARYEAMWVRRDPSAAALLSRAEPLLAEMRDAQDEAIRVGSDPVADPAAVRRACWRLAFVTGKLRGWSRVVEAGMQRGGD